MGDRPRRLDKVEGEDGEEVEIVRLLRNGFGLASVDDSQCGRTAHQETMREREGVSERERDRVCVSV